MTFIISFITSYRLPCWIVALRHYITWLSPRVRRFFVIQENLERACWRRRCIKECATAVSQVTGALLNATRLWTARLPVGSWSDDQSASRTWSLCLSPPCVWRIVHSWVSYGRPLSVSGRPCYILPMFFFYLFIYFLWPPYSPALVNGSLRKFYTWWTLSVIREVTTWFFSWSSLNYRVGQKVT